jgi:hypothetical protein
LYTTIKTVASIQTFGDTLPEKKKESAKFADFVFKSKISLK